MKWFVLPAFAVLAAAASAQVTPTPFFATLPFLTHNFDTNATGTYASLPVFFGIGTAQPIGPGQIGVKNDISAFTAPNLLVGRSADVSISVLVPMRRFGGYFNSGFFGLFSNSVGFRFYDSSNNFIGSATAPLSTSMTWIGFTTTPKWQRVEITGAIPGVQGIVGMDSLRIRPN